MISFCRICLSHISLKDSRSKRIVDFYSYETSEEEKCDIAFFDVLSSCLPDLNLDIPMDSMPRVCGSCCSKICDLYDLKQQSLKIEKLVSQYFTFNNTHDNDGSKTVNLADVASMYTSIFENKYMYVSVSDFVQQLYSASAKQLVETKQTDALIVNSTRNLESDLFRSKVNEETITNKNKDAVILIIEGSSNNNRAHNLDENIYNKSSNNISISHSIVNDFIKGSNQMSAEAWFKLSQTNLLAKKDENSEPETFRPTGSSILIKKVSPNTTNDKKNIFKHMFLRNDGEVPHQKESLERKSDNQESPIFDSTGNNNVASIRKSLRIYNKSQRSQVKRKIPPYITNEKVSQESHDDEQCNNLQAIPKHVQHLAAKRKLETSKCRFGKIDKWYVFSKNLEQKFHNSTVPKALEGNTQNQSSINEMQHKIQMKALTVKRGELVGNRIFRNPVQNINDTINVQKIHNSAVPIELEVNTQNQPLINDIHKKLQMKVLTVKRGEFVRNQIFRNPVQNINETINVQEIHNSAVPIKVEVDAENQPSINEIQEKIQMKALTVKRRELMQNRILMNPMKKINDTINLNSDTNISHKCKKCENHFHSEDELKAHLCVTISTLCEFCKGVIVNIKQRNQHKCNTSTSSDNSTNSKNVFPSQNNPNENPEAEFLEQIVIDNQLEADLEIDEPMEMKKNFVCEICDMDFLTKTNLSNHVAASHMSLGMYNEVSPDIQVLPQKLQFQDTSTVNVDMKENERCFLDMIKKEKENFQCSHCPLTFDVEDNFLLHQALHKNAAEKVLFQCDECDQKFKYAYHLRLHKDNHSPRQCPICGISFYLPHKLHAHILSMHTQNNSIDKGMTINREQIIAPATRPIKNDTPSIVDQLYSSSKDVPTILTPTSSTNNQPQYVCLQCGDLFSCQSELESHEKDHAESIKAECEICEQEFPSQAAVQSHQNSTCSKSFLHNDKPDSGLGNKNKCEKDIDQKDLGITVFTKRGGHYPVYQCYLCRKKFISRDFLMNHLRTHDKYSSLPICKHCNFVFSDIEKLNRHISLKHKIRR